MVHVPFTYPEDIINPLLLKIPEMSPPENCNEQPPEASIWKKLTVPQFPVVAADMEIVSPTSQLGEEPPPQLAVILAELSVQPVTVNVFVPEAGSLA